jgi:hypothetical protein
MPLGRALLPLAFAVAAAAMPSMARIYKNEAARVRSFEPPPSWQPAPQASYPRLLVSYSHPDGGRLMLTTQKIAPGTSAAALADAAAPLLMKQGCSDLKRSDDNGRARLDARLDDRRFLKQVYVVDGAQAWVISLVAGAVNQPQMERDFESAVRSLVIAPQ